MAATKEDSSEYPQRVRSLEPSTRFPKCCGLWPFSRATQHLQKLEVAAPPAILQKEAKKVKKNPLFEKTPRSYRVGAAIQPRVDLSRVVKWPKSRAYGISF